MPTLPAATPPRASRAAALALCIVLAALLNLGGLGMAGQMAAADIPTTHRPAPPPLRARMVVLTPEPQPAERPAALPQAVTVSSAVPATPSPPRAEPRAEFAVASAERSPPPHAGERPLRLYGFDEVDAAAEPVDEWAIDIATLDDAGVSRLVFELMVDDRGGVIGCTVLDPTGLDDAVRRQLEQRIAATALRPAVRGGRFVASVRRIVLQVEDPV